MGMFRRCVCYLEYWLSLKEAYSDVNLEENVIFNGSDNVI